MGFVLCAWLVRVGLSTRGALVALFAGTLAFESLLDFFAGVGDCLLASSSVPARVANTKVIVHILQKDFAISAVIAFIAFPLELFL